MSAGGKGCPVESLRAPAVKSRNLLS